MNILEAGDFDLDDLTERLTEALIDESQWNEILQLTGATATLVIECFDKVNDIEIGLRSRYRILTTV